MKRTESLWITLSFICSLRESNQHVQQAFILEKTMDFLLSLLYFLSILFFLRLRPSLVFSFFLRGFLLIPSSLPLFPPLPLFTSSTSLFSLNRILVINFDIIPDE